MPFQVTPAETLNKANLLKYFRERSNEHLAELRNEIGSANHKKLASGINKKIVRSLNSFVETILSRAKNGASKLARNPFPVFGPQGFRL